jgi:hypothetical protein
MQIGKRKREIVIKTRCVGFASKYYKVGRQRG